ncbi:hypothetical protein NIES2104_63610 [Leptolyngbya sp. NIES-2104]|nr:hypothetical protein NIES2104_63610 [Leptolyngbya sp. NIES-2104]
MGCFAPLLRRPFYELNNARIAPFTCLFAKNKSLTIQAKTLAKLSNDWLFQTFARRSSEACR